MKNNFLKGLLMKHRYNHVYNDFSLYLYFSMRKLRLYYYKEKNMREQFHKICLISILKLTNYFHTVLSIVFFFLEHYCDYQFISYPNKKVGV